MGLLRSLERRASPESPTTNLANPASWLYEAFGATSTPAGVSVNNAKATTVAAWYQGVNIVAKGVASTPLHVYQRLERGRDKAVSERVYHLLKTRPNPENTAYDFHEMMTAAQVSWGAGYAEIEWQRGGDPEALWWLPPADCKVVRTGTSPRAKGLEPDTKYVAVKLPPGVEPPDSRLVVHEGYVYLPPGKYIHIPGLSFDGLSGANLVKRAKRAIGLGMALEEFISRFFSQGAKAATIIAPKEGYSIPPERRDKIVQKLSEQVGGLSGSHRMAAVEAGIDIHTIGVSPQAAEFLGLFVNQKREIASFLDIPPYRMGADDAGQSYASITAKQIDLLTWTHLPMLIRAGQVYTHELMPDRREPLERRVYYAEFSYNSQLRAEPKVRAETDALRVRNGLATRNEIRAEHNMNPHPSPVADELTMELNLISLDAEIEPQGEDRSGIAGEARRLPERRGRMALLRQRLRRAQVPVFVRMGEKILGREVADMKRLLTRVFSSAAPLDTLEDEILEFHDPAFNAAFERDLVALVRAFAAVLASAVSDELGRSVEVTDEVNRFTDEFATAAAALHVRSSRGQLLKVIERRDPTAGLEALHDALVARLDLWAENRAEDMAGNLTTKAGGALAVELYAAASVTSLIWVGGDCPLCSSLNGMVVGTRQNFLTAGAIVSAEGANPLTVDRNISHPPLHPPECDCVILAA